MNKNTPGPWVQDKWGHIRKSNGEAVPFGSLTLAMYNSDEIRANDKLTCAAPELLDALKYAVDLHTPGRTDGPAHHHVDMFLRQARAAIDKATGSE